MRSFLPFIFLIASIFVNTLSSYCNFSSSLSLFLFFFSLSFWISFSFSRKQLISIYIFHLLAVPARKLSRKFLPPAFPAALSFHPLRASLLLSPIPGLSAFFLIFLLSLSLSPFPSLLLFFFLFLFSSGVLALSSSTTRHRRRWKHESTRGSCFRE